MRVVPRRREPAVVGRMAGIVALALVVAACTDTTPSTTTTSPPTTTFAPIEIVPISTTVAAGVESAVHEQLTAHIDELVAITQELRGLSYIQLPSVAIVAADEFAARLRNAVAAELDEATLAQREATYRLLGQYRGRASLAGVLRRVYSADEAVAFYDGAAAQVVVDATRAEPTALEDSIIVRALAWALIDQYHDAYDRLIALEEAGSEDATDAFRTLVEADAIAVQLRYLQGLGELERESAATAALASDRPELAALPDVVRAQLTLPGEIGVPFVDGIVAAGGYAALDAAYDPGPATTEQVMYPERFAVGEKPRQVPELAVSIDGYTTVDEGTYGAWRLRLLLEAAIDPGLLTQTVAGWGGDAHQLLVAGDEMVFAYIYGGDTEQDAIEVVQALLALARGPLGAGDGIDSGGGVLWDDGERYIFADRIGDGLKFIVATDSAAGDRARAQIRVP